jgi:ubiquinone/menaquinone biosynthesis C-methylase UbiE
VSKRRDALERFSERYSAPVAEAALVVEREAIGANVGANGYTTVAQADLLAERLGLSDGDLLLDIGCGRGWPGLHLAKKSGCLAVLSDLPVPALKWAFERRDDQTLPERVSVVRASATELPFPANTFDAISHSDTL